ncbi:MAG TPA: M48 family metalloprotease, partial [Acidobacteriaceae bacterium]|nr:M48 family metalloprotease [Acidobacteriaceae bacterium]
MKTKAIFPVWLGLTLSVAILAAPGDAQSTQQPASAPASSPSTAGQSSAPAAADSEKPNSEKSGSAQADASQPADASSTVDTAKAGDKDSKESKKDAKKDKDAKNVPTAKPLVLAEPGSHMEEIKTGSIDDVNAVGNRDIGKRGVGNWYSTDSEIRMGRQYAAEIEKSTKFITDPVVTEYVNRIGQNLVKNSDAKVPFTIKVIDSDEINAMALPGGFFYVNSGLILNADEEAELAGVMAHEIAHVAAHHAARQMTRANYAQLGTIPLIFIGGWTGYGIYEAANIGIPMTFLQFSREFEAQADFLGVQYMYRA